VPLGVNNYRSPRLRLRATQNLSFLAGHSTSAHTLLHPLKLVALPSPISNSLPHPCLTSAPANLKSRIFFWNHASQTADGGRSPEPISSSSSRHPSQIGPPAIKGVLGAHDNINVIGSIQLRVQQVSHQTCCLPSTEHGRAETQHHYTNQIALPRRPVF
jgi:hypothetical protein